MKTRTVEESPLCLNKVQQRVLCIQKMLFSQRHGCILICGFLSSSVTSYVHDTPTPVRKAVYAATLSTFFPLTDLHSMPKAPTIERAAIASET